MNRRDLLKTIAISGIAGSILNRKTFANTTKFPQKIVYPKALKTGDKIGLIAPGTNTPEIENLDKAQEIIDYLGLKSEFADSIKSGNGYRTKDPKVRADEMMQMFIDDSIKGVFCIRGGYGSQQILNLLDYEIIRKNAKIFTGYSDITALHLAITHNSDMVTFHSPVMTSAFPPYTAKHFKKMIFGENEYPLSLENPISGNGTRTYDNIHTFTSGKASGLLIGGNLSLISALMGTPYEINTDGKILFIEDVGEAPYSIDRMLSQLQLAGKLNNLKGIVFGKCEGCKGNSSVWDSSLLEVIEYYLKPLDIPAFYGLLIGHSTNQLTLPEYGKVQIDADKGQLQIISSPVV